MRNLPKSQDGVALFISLVLLLVLTIIGVSSVQTTSLEVRMTRNEHDSMLAFQAAESALRDAEVVVEAVTFATIEDDFTEAGNNGLYEGAEMEEQPIWQRADIWEVANSREAETNVDGVSAQARYIVEHVDTIVRSSNPNQITGQDDDFEEVEIFRITARGIGGSPNSQVTLQSSYGRIL